MSTESQSSHGDVLQVVTDFDAALERGDYAAAAGLCTSDFTFIGSGDGEESFDVSEFPTMMRSLLDAIGSELVSWSLTFSEPYRITVHGDAALVTRIGDAELVMRNGVRQTRYRLTGALRRTGAGWRWWLFHGSEPQPW